MSITNKVVNAMNDIVIAARRVAIVLVEQGIEFLMLNLIDEAIKIVMG